MRVPGWHETTRIFQEQDRLQLVGIVQEQHPDRARLFMQWKKMEWPVLIDSLDLLGVTVVPLSALIDERGNVVAVQPSPSDVREFVESPAPEQTIAPTAPPAPPKRGTVDRRIGSQEDADALQLWGDAQALDDAIGIYEKLLADAPNDGETRFHLGVAYRTRHDSAAQRRGDFERAVDQWAAALDSQPNQYIWRRRIQQYGPRLAKPYPFYDWVATAREEIEARGETPFPLAVEPAGAELAQPSRQFVTENESAARPDPDGRIQRDRGKLIAVETVAIPPAVSPGEPLRVHLALQPQQSRQAHWNNESGDLVVWIEAPEGWQVGRRYLTRPNPPHAVSDETRSLEVELQAPKDASGTVTIPAYALYYVCEGAEGTCLYRRQDFAVEVEIR